MPSVGALKAHSFICQAILTERNHCRYFSVHVSFKRIPLICLLAAHIEYRIPSIDKSFE